MKTNINKAIRYISTNRLSLFLLILLCALYFFRSFVLYINIFPPVGTEECHTGAIVREILEHGLQFPIEQYTPEYYESSILVGGILTLIPGALMGVSRLSIELVPFVISLVTLLIFISLLLRGGMKDGLWFFIISYFFASGFFVFVTMESLPGHNLGLLYGVLLIHRFYTWYNLNNPKLFYQLMLLIGLGLVIHKGSMLYAGLCVLVFFLYRPLEGEKPQLNLSILFKGIFLFILGAIPFIVFLFKTNFQNATYLFGVVGRRTTGIENWNTYLLSVYKHFLFQFDNRLLVALFYLLMVFLAWAVWAKVRRKPIPENNRLLLCIVCFFPLPLLTIIVVFSGRDFTTYYTYFLPFLFLAGTAFFTHLIEQFNSRKIFKRGLQLLLSAALITFLLSGRFSHHLNFSFSYAMNELTANKNQSFCYWRFGHAFGNYVSYEGDSAAYASKIIEACSRFDSEEKRNECLWGWFDVTAYEGHFFEEEALEVLSTEDAELLAMSIGGWSFSFSVCDKLPPEFVDDCILGKIERSAVIHYSFLQPDKRYIQIPCQPPPGSPHFSGLVQEILDTLREDAENGPPQPTCPANLNMMCVVADSYCAAINRQDNYCKSSYSSREDVDVCRYIYRKVLKAQEVKQSAHEESE